MIRKVSKKQSANLRLYAKVREETLFENPNCQAITEHCSYNATEIHHKKGRIGELLTDKRYFLAVCRNCHTWIEEHPKEAKELGFSVSRLSI